MTIAKYFVGGELEAFVDGSYSGIGFTTTAGTYDSDFSRGAVGFTGFASNYIRIPLTSAQAACWVSFQEYVGTAGSAGQSGTWTTFNNASGTAFARVQGVGGTQDQPLVQLQYWNGSAWANIGTPRVVPVSALHKWDFQIKLDASVGVFAAYVDGNSLGTLSGNTSFVSPATLAEVRVFPPAASANACQVYISECQILDTSTLGRRLATLSLTGTGATDAWTPSTGATSVATVDEVGSYADSDYAASPTANQIYTGVTSDLSTAAQQYAVDAVVIAYRALKGGTGPQNLQGVVRVGGTNYASGTNVANLITGYGYTWDAFDTNPATSAAWTPTVINTAGFETGAKSIT